MIYDLNVEFLNESNDKIHFKFGTHFAKNQKKPASKLNLSEKEIIDLRLKLSEIIEDAFVRGGALRRPKDSV